MARLIDDIRAQKQLQAPWFIQSHLSDEWQRYGESLGALLLDPDLPVILIDNVADYYYRGSDQERWNEKDFPNLAPVFPSFWCEHRMPSVIHSREMGTTDVRQVVQHGKIGSLVVALDPQNVKGEGIPEETHWILWCDLFIDYGQPGQAIQGPHGGCFVALDSSGASLGPPWMQTYSNPEYNDILKDFLQFYHPTYLALSFLHCKNVKVVENAVDKPLAKKYHARTGIHPTRYKTLVIEPLKEILRKEGRSGDVGLIKAMHICRGHFADYTEGRGLFGKYHGRFWIPATVRGTKKRGQTDPLAREIEVKV